MKTIGLIGGMSWESTVTYYQLINETVKEALGGLHSARCIVYSLDFDGIEKLQTLDRWEEAGGILAHAAKGLELAGADLILIGANTMHLVYDQVQAAVNVPVMHIAQVTADALKEQGISKAGLLGTRYTVEKDFYIGVLEKNGIEALISAPDRIAEVNRIIYDELCVGKLLPSSRDTLLDEIRIMKERGAKGIILGCTELGLLVRPEDTDMPLFDTAVIHAVRAAKYSLENGS